MVFGISTRKSTAATRMLVLLLVAMIVGNLAFIWINSAKVSTESNKSSHKIAKVVAENTVKNFESLSKPEQQKHIKKANNKVRSMAHFAEFIPLGLLVCLLFLVLLYSSDYRRLCLVCAILSLAICALCALGDEVHQIFVKGRSFEIIDIFTDTLGSAVGIAAAALMTMVAYRVYSRKIMK